jgi:alkanesulfonate monooxygenase SsuD/methylene tetrahydromethanopterin reductase-like flavin-dependent oxidoreductase (luciferase family)
MQAGSSGRDRAFAARWAQVVFTLQHSKPDVQAFYADVKTRVSEAGRPTASCAILPGIDVVLGETRSIAREKADYLGTLVNAEFGVAEISNATGSNLAGRNIDTPVAAMPPFDRLSHRLEGVRQLAVSGGAEGLCGGRRESTIYNTREGRLSRAIRSTYKSFDPEPCWSMERTMSTGPPQHWTHSQRAVTFDQRSGRRSGGTTWSGQRRECSPSQ